LPMLFAAANKTKQKKKTLFKSFIRIIL